MDILKELNERLHQLEGLPTFDGIRAAIRHIELAEKHYNRAIEEHDEDAFNDVIYRTNQAFEGMLKEAYEIAAGKTGNGVTPNKIEKYFIDNEEYKGRIMQLLANYRQDWRNPSTHDHSLIFNDDEAILAISSVTAFAFILLGGILEKVNFIRGQQAAVESDIAVEEKSSTDSKIVNAILSFYEDVYKKEFLDTSKIREQEIIGRLGGYLTNIFSSLRITRDMHLNVGDPARADFIVSGEEGDIIIEIKRPSKSISSIKLGYHQVLRYLELANWRNGILFVASIDKSDPVSVVEVRPTINEGEGKIYIVSKFSEGEIINILNLNGSN